MANALRLSQIVTTFGPGAMVDLPTRSVMIGGTNLWDVRDPTVSRIINEPRLQQLLERSMREAGRLAANGKITLRTPPIDADTPGFTNPHCIDALVFPTLFICERTEQVPNQPIRRRRLVKWEQLDGNSLKHKYRMSDDKLVDVSPIRFIGACEQGHIEDIDWRWVVHEGGKCDRPMYLEEKGTSGSPADTAIVCDCGQRISFQETNIVGRLGPCHGERPWLGSRNREPCSNRLKLLIRTATNTYFTQLVTVISLAQEVDALAKAVEGIWHVIGNVPDLATLTTLTQHVPDVRVALQGFDLNDCLATIVRRRDDGGTEASPHPRAAEFDLLASGKATIGNPGRDSHLFAETLPENAWRRVDKTVTAMIKGIVGVQRLREVSCLYGFTRFEPAPTIEDDIEEVRLAVSGAPVGETLDWLPAIEQFGEGVFVQFDPSVVAAWLERPEVLLRQQQLFAGFRKWQAARPGREHVRFPGMPYILIHSLSHALMVEMALESGYPASSLKERVYALRDTVAGTTVHRLGLLIYTASTGAQGTLGGLVGSASRIVEIIDAALARVTICSNDPVCADHNPTSVNDDRHLHGAACHGCLLVAETSCEKRNEFLDRALLVQTMAGNGSELIADLGQLAGPNR
jgi:hypothetical protein